MSSFIFSTNSSSRREKVSDWAGHKKRSSSVVVAPVHLIDNKEDWKDVHTNIKQMDQFYDATFYAWLKSEENVLVTSIYLHRIANEYPLERIINALEWLTNDWRWESTSILVRHVTVDWCDEHGDVKRAKLLGHLTMNWATHFTATLITTILISSPYSTCSVSTKRERFLREFTKDWDFSKLSEFFMFLRSRANIDYKFKCMLLQEAARKDNNSIKKGTTATASTSSTSSSSSKKSSDLTSNSSAVNSVTSTNNHHHRRTSSNDFQEMKRTILEEMEEETHHHPASEQNIPPSFSPMNDRCYNTCVNTNSNSGSVSNNTSPSTSSSTATSALYASSSSSRYHHVNITNNANNNRLCTSSSTLTMTVTNAANATISSSTSTSTTSVNHTTATSDITPSPSSSTNNTNSNDKRRITVI